MTRSVSDVVIQKKGDLKFKVIILNSLDFKVLHYNSPVLNVIEYLLNNIPSSYRLYNTSRDFLDLTYLDLFLHESLQP